MDSPTKMVVFRPKESSRERDGMSARFDVIVRDVSFPLQCHSLRSAITGSTFVAL